MSRVRQPLLWGLCLSALAPPGAKAAGCMNMRGGELVISASDDCVAQMRRDPATRQQVARHISRQVGGQAANGPVVAAAAPVATPAPADPRSHGRGLDHPLARLSMLNSQSRYLWSLGNPAPVYYGQTQAR
ncbi:hypothetical protein [Ideonella sp.]|uniref:hypothetical protein n=1 Tax=Ideonella sp. TaxID=1929293 RepID=UPI0035B394D6